MILAGSPKAVLTPAESGLSVISIVDAPGGPAGMTWVGSAPWLDTDDQLTSYAQGVVPAKPAWLIDPTAGLSGTLTVTRSAFNTLTGVSTNVYFWVHDTDVLTAPGADLYDDALDQGDTFQPPGFDWVPMSIGFTVTPQMATAAAAGRLIVVALIGEDIALSLLRVEGGGYIPLRQRNRGRLRQRNKAARQDGIRQRGFL